MNAGGLLGVAVVLFGATGDGFVEPARWADAPDRTRRVLILGDSMAATDFGRALQRWLNRHPQVTCRRFGRSATGLARPDFYDWMRRARQLLRRHDPDVVVVVIGGNDGQDLLNHEGKGRVRYRTSAWEPEYERRLYHFGELLAEQGRRVMWLELPAMARPRFERKLRQIRRLQEEVTALLPRNRYVATRAIFYGDGGELRHSVPGRRKLKGGRPMRQDDGIHFTVEGADYFARRVLSDILVGLNLGGTTDRARPRPPIWTSSEPSAGASSPSRPTPR